MDLGALKLRNARSVYAHGAVNTLFFFHTRLRMCLGCLRAFKKLQKEIRAIDFSPYSLCVHREEEVSIAIVISVFFNSVVKTRPSLSEHRQDDEEFEFTIVVESLADSFCVALPSPKSLLHSVCREPFNFSSSQSE